MNSLLVPMTSQKLRFSNQNVKDYVLVSFMVGILELLGAPIWCEIEI